MSNQEHEVLSPGWHKTKIVMGIITGIFTAVGTVLIPLAIAYYTEVHSEALKESEIRVRYVELAIGVLREDPKKQDMQELRTWAITVINKYSKIPLPEKIQDELKKKKLEVKTGGFGSHAFGEGAFGE